jgi:hypothetical protein
VVVPGARTRRKTTGNQMRAAVGISLCHQITSLELGVGKGAAGSVSLSVAFRLR